MKKIIFTLITAIAISLNVSAQVMEIYKDDILITTYDASQANRVVFKENKTEFQPTWYVQETTGKTYDVLFTNWVYNAIVNGYIDAVFDRKTGELLNNKYDFDLYSKAIQIINENTLAYYNLKLGLANGNNENLPEYSCFLYNLVCGEFSYFFSEPTYYTYTSLNGKLFVSNGDIYTVIDEALIPDGKSTKFMKTTKVEDRETKAASLKKSGFDYTEEVSKNVSADYEFDYDNGWMMCNFVSSISDHVDMEHSIKWGVAGLQPEVQDYFSDSTSDTQVFNLNVLSFLDPTTAEEVFALKEVIEVLTKSKEEGRITSDEIRVLDAHLRELELFQQDIRKTMKNFHGYLFVMINNVKYVLTTF